MTVAAYIPMRVRRLLLPLASASVTNRFFEAQGRGRVAVLSFMRLLGFSVPPCGPRMVRRVRSRRKGPCIPPRGTISSRSAPSASRATWDRLDMVRLDDIANWSRAFSARPTSRWSRVLADERPQEPRGEQDCSWLEPAPDRQSPLAGDVVLDQTEGAVRPTGVT